MKSAAISFCCFFFAFCKVPAQSAWIRINQLGYQPGSIKTAVWASKQAGIVKEFSLVDAKTNKVVYTASAGTDYGSYGPFTTTFRLDFSRFEKPGRYFIRAGGINSAVFVIDKDAYKGSADFCLRYMRQQRSGFNPFLRDSCHTHDGYTLYGTQAGLPDSSFVDASGGWHDASDYLQYVTTSATATYQLLAAWRDFPSVFTDEHEANGLPGKNGVVDIADEAKWGLDWLLKMHPKPGVMFNQLADDRDHMGMRIPGEDSFYGKGYERPVYFLSGEPQQRGKFMNHTTGTTSTAAKMASAFALGNLLLKKQDSSYAALLYEKAQSAFVFAGKKKGVAQTASVRSPYIYAEENWKDDAELAMAMLGQMEQRLVDERKKGLLVGWSGQELFEPVTPWLGSDTASHYQWYPFVNAGHYEVARYYRQQKGRVPNEFPAEKQLIAWYREGIDRVWKKAKMNAFYRGIPFIWCSNNLTASFAMQCYWYRKLSGSREFEQLEQACFDWLFGCNPWGTSMVYGLPAEGDTPVDPHSAFTHLKSYPIDGGLVDGPVYGSIYGSLIGIQLKDPDEYAAFQSDLAVYHDDYGDYSTNEPTMDGTASLIYLLASREHAATRVQQGKGFSYDRGAIIRGDSLQHSIALVFTGHDFAGEGKQIADELKRRNIPASFFFTGDFYRNPAFAGLLQQLKKDGHYLGPHSDHHLLYCDWSRRDSLLVSRDSFTNDLTGNIRAMQQVARGNARPGYFLPAYEWYNDSVAKWSEQSGQVLVNYTPGTRSTSDYTWPGLKNYRSSEEIFNSIITYEQQHKNGLNGFLLLLHAGTDPRRTDKFSGVLPRLLDHLVSKRYRFVRVDELLKNN